MAKRKNIVNAQRRARADERKALRALDAARGITADAKTADAGTTDAKVQKTLDSFVNFAQMLGIGAANALSTASYGFNPITRIRTLLEWIHRGSWLGGVAIDVVAEDMTREGVELLGSLEPADIGRLAKAADRLQIWSHLCDTVKWARLYGGCIAVMLIDGQRPDTPLNLSTVSKGQFKGLLVLDRWMIEPSLNNLVTEMGPNLGLPKFYTVTADAPALPKMRIHYSRCIRLEGVRLPYWQRVMENLWGISVLERLYDRMQAFDSATTGSAQLVYKSYIRTIKIKNLRQVAAAGGDAMKGLVAQVDMMRQFQNQEGITLLDADDEFEGHTHGAFAGLSDALVQFGQQVSGALQVPLIRLFGQSPAGFSTGDTDLRNYYDGIKQKQERELGDGVTLVYKVLAASEAIELPDDFEVNFKPLWQLSDEQKATIASADAATVASIESQGIIGRATALRELKQSSRTTGRFTNIDEKMIEAAEGEEAPGLEGLLPGQTASLPFGAPEDTNIVAVPRPSIELPAKDSAVKAAGVLFRDPNGRILLLRRARNEEREGEWDMPGGHLETGESPIDAAVRESLEETGMRPKSLGLIRENSGYATYKAYTDEFHPKLSDEHDLYEWLAPDEALKRELHPGLRAMLEGMR